MNIEKQRFDNHIRLIDQKYTPRHVRVIGIAVRLVPYRKRWRERLGMRVFRAGLWLIRKSGVHVCGRVDW